MFTFDEYRKALDEAGQKVQHGSVYMNRLLRAGWVERLDKGIYRKL